MQRVSGFLSKGRRSLYGLVTALLLFTVVANVFSPIQASAASVTTVEGKVAAGSTDDLLKLDTASSGQMLIKMDEGLKITGGGMIIGAKVSVDVGFSNDGYLHTSAIRVTGTNWGAVVDTTSTLTVSGKILDGTTESLLKFEYSGSQFLIRLDSATEYKGCRILEKGKTIEVTVARGSDAYLHAVKISGDPTTSSIVSAIKDVPAKTSDGRAISVVNGVVQNGTTDAVLVIKVNGNVFNVKIDSATDIKEIHALIPDTTIGLAVYVGADGAFHAYKMVGSIDTSTPSRAGDTIKVTGVVQKNTNDKILYLKTNAGDMIIKLDKDTDLGTTGLLLLNKTVDVTVQRGSDAYLHAVKISSNATAATASTSSDSMSPTADKTSDYINVQGTVESNTTNAVLYLKVSGQVMNIRIDKNTKWPESDALRTGTTVTAVVYRGSDAYLHAESITSNLDSAPSATVNTASKLSFRGTIEKVDGYTITLKSNDNTYTFRFDDSTDFSGFRLLNTGKTVTIDAATGSDGYWRAISVYL